MAFRYLSAKASSLTYVSRLALVGLALSVAVLVIVLSVVNGFERELRERILSVLPHVTILGYGGLTSQEVEDLRNLRSSALVSLSPVVQGTALLAAGDTLRGARVTGIEISTYEQVTDLGRYTRSGGLQALGSDTYGLILGRKLAADLNLAIGDTVRLIIPTGGVSAAGAIPRQRRMRVVDIFDSRSQLDSQGVYLNLATAQRLFRTGSRVHGMQGRVTDLLNVQPLRRDLLENFGDTRMRVQSWMRSHGPLYQAIAVQKLTMFVLLSFLVGVAAFNLVSGLVMIVEQRKHDVAVLRTLGAPSSSVVALFCLVGVILSIAGILSGLAVGVLLAASLPGLYEIATEYFQLDLMNQYFISYLPVDVRVADLLVIGFSAFGLALLATIFPAWQASRLKPSRVLAHE